MGKSDVFYIIIMLYNTEPFLWILVNPFCTKQMPWRKSDVADAQWIATAEKQLVIIWNALEQQQPYLEPKIVITPVEIERKQKYYLH